VHTKPQQETFRKSLYDFPKREKKWAIKLFKTAHFLLAFLRAFNECMDNNALHMDLVGGVREVWLEIQKKP